MNTTLPFPRTGSPRWSRKQRFAASVGALALFAAGAVTAITQLDRPGAPATVAPPVARTETPAEPPRRYYLVSSQGDAEQLRTWLRHDDAIAAAYAEIFVTRSATERAAVHDLARLVFLYDGVELPVVDLTAI